MEADLTPAQLDAILRKKREQVDRMSLFSDLLFTAVFGDDIPCVEHFLRVAMRKRGLKVSRIIPQKDLANLTGRSAVLDLVAVDGRRNHYNIEIQQSSAGAGARRLRYHASLIDAFLALDRGEAFGRLADTYIIFMTKRDVKKLGWPKYEYEFSLKNRCKGAEGAGIPESVKWLDAGLHFIFLNGAFGDLATPEGRLAHDFRCTRARDVLAPAIRKKMSEVKDTDQGRAKMDKLIEEIYGDQMRAKVMATKAAIVTSMLAEGDLPVDKIARCVKLPLEDVLKIKEGRDPKTLN